MLNKHRQYYYEGDKAMEKWFVIGKSIAGEWLIIDVVSQKPPVREAFPTHDEAQQECDKRNCQRL